MSLVNIVISGVTYQSYASVAEADQYLAVDPQRSATWVALTDDQKGSHLVQATRRLDLERYPGEKTDPAQNLQWPRTGATCNGVAIPPDAIPQQLEDATIVLAGAIALDPGAAANSTAGSNIERVQAGSASVTFFRPTATSYSLSASVPDAFALLRCLLGGIGAGFGAASGTGASSSFSNINAPDINEGWP